MKRCSFSSTPLECRRIEDVGEVGFFRHPHARRLKIILKPMQGIRVTVPDDISLNLAEAFVREKREWIKKQMPAIQAREAEQTLFLPGTPFSTRRHALEIRKTERPEISARVTQSTISIRLPAQSDPASPAVQDKIRESIERAWRREAQEDLPPLVAREAARLGISYTDVRIKNSRARWGSCSSRGRINLSLHIMRLPDHLIRYIILHELIHREIPHHGTRFWTRLEEVFPGARDCHKELRNQNPRFY